MDISRKLLPVVSQGVVNSVLRDLLNSNIKLEDYLIRRMAEIEKDNPRIPGIITAVVENILQEKNPAKAALYSALGGILVYNALKSQAEAEQMEKDLRGKI